MTDLATLTSLRDRLRDATGADRELDADIMAALFEWAQRGEPYYSPACAGEEPIYWHAPGWLRKQPCPHLTASLDAAVALCERVLPGVRKSLRVGDNYAYATLFKGYGPHQETLGTSDEWPDDDMIAIALCHALVNALIAEERGE